MLNYTYIYYHPVTAGLWERWLVAENFRGPCSMHSWTNLLQESKPFLLGMVSSSDPVTELLTLDLTALVAPGKIESGLKLWIIALISERCRGISTGSNQLLLLEFITVLEKASRKNWTGFHCLARRLTSSITWIEVHARCLYSIINSTNWNTIVPLHTIVESIDSKNDGCWHRYTLTLQCNFASFPERKSQDNHIILCLQKDEIIWGSFWSEYNSYCHLLEIAIPG